MKKTSTDIKAQSSRLSASTKPLSLRPRKSYTCSAGHAEISIQIFPSDLDARQTQETLAISLSKSDMLALERWISLLSPHASGITRRLTFQAICSVLLNSMLTPVVNSSLATGKKPRRKGRTTSSKLSKPNLKAGSHTFPMTRPYRALRFGILEQPKAETA